MILPGSMMPLRIERMLDRAHHIDRLAAELGLEIGHLAEPTPCSPVQVPSERRGRARRCARERPARAISPACPGRPRAEMEIAVADMPDDGRRPLADRDPAWSRRCIRPAREIGTQTSVIQRLRAGPQASAGIVGVVARRPQLVARLGAASAQSKPAPPCSAAISGSVSACSRHAGRGAVEFEEQRRRLQMRARRSG